MTMTTAEAAGPGSSRSKEYYDFSKQKGPRRWRPAKRASAEESSWARR
jgi:hypothetical protein